ncbi:MAG TPA: tetratricopeptide repeat protein [Candidatus Limenecus avicola]|uniref:Tetratricopeptide repeat protein n=1 Tax=Candidatus Limenecus avicola TaxID=2840847 RepID=A0A9D1MZG5_9CLOT|nr:tetratricopeptide repeat protein [Clostridium sp.]HIU92368.1 tetratricopeptide repeat protein [Candidatus Limenecus avicola]
MLEQHDMDKMGNTDNTEVLNQKEKERKENVANMLEKARVYHEKYLLRNNTSDMESAVNYYIQAIKLNPQIPETYYRLACLMFENGQISLDSAIEQCKMAIDIAPENPNAHLYTGYFLKLANDFDEAEKEFKNAIKVSPLNSARPRLILATMLYQKINNVKPSLVDFIRMVYYACSGCLTVLWDFASIKMLYKNISDDALVFMYKTYGHFLEKIKNSSLAVATYDIAAENTGRDEYFYNRIGDICIKEHAPEIALDAYKKVLEANPYDRDALVKQATLIQTHFPDNYDEAIDCYTKLLEIEPENDKVYYELGHLYLQKNESLPAVNAFSMALEKDDENPFYHNSMAFALVQLEQYDDAIEHYQKAININPDPYWTSIVCQALGSVYLEIKNNPEAAIVLYQTAAVLNPECDESQLAIGDTYFSMEEYDNAIRAYCDAIKINPENAKAYCKCGMALWEKDYTEEAIVAYHKAIDLNPDYAIAHNNLGVIYLDDIGNTHEAIALFEKAISENKSYTLAYFNLGRAYAITGENTKAAKNFQRALDLNVLTGELEEEDILNRLHKLFEV